MSIFSKSFIRIFGQLVLMISIAQNAGAGMPEAGRQIGTKATITFMDASGVPHERQSDAVYTRIAQVYQVRISPLRNPAHVEAGGNADIPFQVHNVGNGTDDVTLSVSDFPKGIDAVTFFSADAGGALQSDTGIESVRGDSTTFTLNGMKPGGDDQRYFVLRVPVPASARKDATYDVGLDVKMKNGESKGVTAKALVVERKPFSVVPVGTSKLNEDKRAWVSFRVKDAPATKKGYFEMWLVNSSAMSTPLRYKITDKVLFDGDSLDTKQFDDGDKTLFKMTHEVGANSSYLIRMPIEIPSAKRGDAIVMFVKYGEAATSRDVVKPMSDSDLDKSTGFVLRFDHIEKAPELEVTGNSAGGGGRDFTTVGSAVPGQAIDYELKLRNNSTFDDTFILEEMTAGKGELIAAMTPLDKDGQLAVPIGMRGLPEIGPVPANDEMKFKIRVRLREGRVSKQPQSVQFRIRSLRASTTDPIVQMLTIGEVLPGSNPLVRFSNVEGMSASIDKLVLADGGDSARFYMDIHNADNTDGVPRQYEMRFAQKGFSIRSYSHEGCGAPVTNSGAVDAGGKIFCVDADLTGLSSLDGEVIVTDPVSMAETKMPIAITKQSVVVFASTGYRGNGVPHGDAALTIGIVNRGGDMTGDQYVLLHDTSDAASPTIGWPILFSFDESTWAPTLVLSDMKSRAVKDVFVKIGIPGDVSLNRTWALTLGLQKAGETSSSATTVVTLALDESGLIVVKEIAIVKSMSAADCSGGSVPDHFSKAATDEVEDGDCIWYRISVTNPPAAATVRNLSISDPIPKHSSYNDGASAEPSAAKPSISAGSIVTEGIDLKSDQRLVLTYPVVVDFKK